MGMQSKHQPPAPPGRAIAGAWEHFSDRAKTIYGAGGEPLGEAIVMFWNFIGSSHDDVAAYRAEWQAQITRDGEVVGDSQEVAEGRFGTVVGDHLAPIPAPVLPNARLKERR